MGVNRLQAVNYNMVFAIGIFFEILNYLDLRNIVYFIAGCTIYNPFGLVGP